MKYTSWKGGKKHSQIPTKFSLFDRWGYVGVCELLYVEEGAWCCPECVRQPEKQLGKR